jgi:hypothetical protein
MIANLHSYLCVCSYMYFRVLHRVPRAPPVPTAWLVLFSASFATMAPTRVPLAQAAALTVFLVGTPVQWGLLNLAVSVPKDSQ